MQDDILIDGFSSNPEIAAFEHTFSQIDAYNFEFEKLDSKMNSKNDTLIKEVEYALTDISLQKAASARLYALLGSAYLIKGNKSQAKNCLESSEKAFKGDARALILSSRLGIEKNLKEKSKAYSDKSLLLLEEALICYENTDYTKSVACFDEAFLSLDSSYRGAYENLRNISWKLRGTSANSSVAALLALKEISVMQMLQITNEDSQLLYNYTLGKDLSNNELYKKIAGAGLLNPVSQELSAENALSKTTIVNKLTAARFLWNLYNHKKNTVQLLTKYSDYYKNQKRRSPVLDVKAGNPDFDATLGCVENEILQLEDGLNFEGEKLVSGAEFGEALNKIK